jgi:hypothetical protein
MAASMSFGTRAEVCGLPALLDHAAHRADSVIFDCPGDVDVHAYVARMDFYANLPTNVVLSRPAPTIRRRDRRSGSSNLSGSAAPGTSKPSRAASTESQSPISEPGRPQGLLPPAGRRSDRRSPSLQRRGGQDGATVSSYPPRAKEARSDSICHPSAARASCTG